MSELSLYKSLIGMPMMAVSATGDIYATGIVESVHTKPCGKPTFWAKLSDTKAAPIEDLVHGRPIASAASDPLAKFLDSGEWASRPNGNGVTASASEPDLLLKLKAWFAVEFGEFGAIPQYEYGMTTAAVALGIGTKHMEKARFWKDARTFNGHEFEVRRLHEGTSTSYRIGFRSTSRSGFITFTRVDAIGKEGQ